MEYLSGQPVQRRASSTSYNNRPDVDPPVNDLLLPPPWTTSATDTSTSFRSLVNFMQRRISDVVGAASSAGFYDTEPLNESYHVNEIHRAG